MIEPSRAEETRRARSWLVIVWDDPVNLMSYVVWVFQTVLGMPRDRATTKMLEVHHEGRSIVAETDREEGELIVEKLHSHGLQATLEAVEA